MPIVNEMKGDLLDMVEDGHFDAIVHGCNCFHKMGAGIALQISKRYPEAVYADLITPIGDYKKLGKISTAEITHCSKQPFTVINAYTQGTTGRDGHYSAICKAFTKINKKFSGKQIGIPLIGCGIAGLEWEIVYKLINEVTPDLEITVVRLP